MKTATTYKYESPAGRTGDFKSKAKAVYTHASWVINSNNGKWMMVGTHKNATLAEKNAKVWVGYGHHTPKVTELEILTGAN